LKQDVSSDLEKNGVQPPSDAMEIYRMAEQILAEGWDE
jgi:hypothetical protein